MKEELKLQNSLVIHPDHFKKERKEGYIDIGSMLGWEQNGNEFHVRCTNGRLVIVFYNDSIVRIMMEPVREVELNLNHHILVMEPEQIEVTTEEDDQYVYLQSNILMLKIKKSPFRVSVWNVKTGCELVSEGDRGMVHHPSGEVLCFKKMESLDHFYGFGEKTGFLDKRGEKMTMWNSDVYAPHNQETDPLYVSIPFFMGLREGIAYGIFFFNTFRTVFNFCEEDEYFFWAEGGQLDYFVFAGPTPKEVVSQYSALTGRMPLPPKWAIGYHQSRYSYQSEDEVRELARTYQRKEIPLDAIHLDIHYMKGYRVFTFDQGQFPQVGKMLQDLKLAGIHVVPIVDPGVKADPEYRVFQQGIQQGFFCKELDGTIFYGKVWPEKSAFPDFTVEQVRAWWGELHRFYSNLGVEGIWNDMNEPSVFNESKTMDIEVVHGNDGRLATHRELHNLYGYYMTESTYEGMKKQLGHLRPFVLTRSGYAGIQRYAAVWTGDNRSFWEHLEMSMPMCMNLGISGVPFCGADVGGFAHDANGQLLIRWIQLGAFIPFFRNHSELKSIRQEPWAFGSKVEVVVRRYISLRYEWLPYLYGLFQEAARTGLPIMRPLFLEFPEDKNTYNLSDQFMLGSQVIIAPIVRPDTFLKIVYLPEGRWYDYWSDEVIQGGHHVVAKAPLDIIPIYIKEGTLLPHTPTKLTTMASDEALFLHVYLPEVGKSAEYTIYEDDGATFDYAKGIVFEERITVTLEDTVTLSIKTEVSSASYTPSWKRKTMIIHHAPLDLQVRLNDTQVHLQHQEGQKGRMYLEWF